MRIKQSFVKIFVVLSMIGGTLFMVAASVNATSNPADAPSDWAFDESSVELNDEIIDRYSSVDTSGDGFISISEANAMSGILEVYATEIVSTLNGIEHFTAVDEIDVSWNTSMYGEIPSNIGNLTNLKELNLSRNNLSGSIPLSIGNMGNLNRLILQENKLTGEIPTTIGDLTNLSSLKLDRNSLGGAVPESLGNLSNLEWLDLRTNRNLTMIPESIGNLTNLTYFDAGQNALTSLPEGLGLLNNLEVFKADANYGIEVVPESLCNLPKLNTLWLSSNLIEKLPDSLINLPTGAYIAFNNNMVSSVTQAQYNKFSENNNSTISDQQFSVELSEKTRVGDDYEFDGLPAYEQFPNYGETFTYILNEPNGNFSEITPTIANGKVVIAGSDLTQAGQYQLEVTVLGGGKLRRSTYYTTFNVYSPVTYASAEADGIADKETSTKITMTLSADIDDLSIDQITLTPKTRELTSVNKKELVSLGNGVYELFIDGTWDQSTAVDVTIANDVLVNSTETHAVTLNQKAELIQEHGKENNGNINESTNNNVKNNRQGVSTNDPTSSLSLIAILLGSLFVLFSVIKFRKTKN